MEYAIGNIVVAISWSSNLTSLFDNIGVHLPDYLCRSFLEVRNGNAQFLNPVKDSPFSLADATADHNLWMNAPHIGSLPIILNIPALIITILVTSVAYVGIKESRTGSNIMVAFKLIVVLAVIAIGCTQVHPN